MLCHKRDFKITFEFSKNSLSSTEKLKEVPGLQEPSLNMSDSLGFSAFITSVPSGTTFQL